jgi:hypothetical protein
MALQSSFTSHRVPGTRRSTRFTVVKLMQHPGAVDAKEPCSPVGLQGGLEDASTRSASYLTAVT